MANGWGSWLRAKELVQKLEHGNAKQESRGDTFQSPEGTAEDGGQHPPPSPRLARSKESVNPRKVSASFTESNFENLNNTQNEHKVIKERYFPNTTSN